MQIEQTPEQIREIRVEILSKMVAEHFLRNQYRCYLRPANGKFADSPPGYAMTFKITNVKRRK